VTDNRIDCLATVLLINCNEHGYIVCATNFAVATATRRHACAVYTKLIITGRIINYRVQFIS